MNNTLSQTQKRIQLILLTTSKIVLGSKKGQQRVNPCMVSEDIKKDALVRHQFIYPYVGAHPNVNFQAKAIFYPEFFEVKGNKPFEKGVFNFSSLTEYEDCFVLAFFQVGKEHKKQIDA